MVKMKHCMVLLLAAALIMTGCEYEEPLTKVKKEST